MFAPLSPFYNGCTSSPKSDGIHKYQYCNIILQFIYFSNCSLIYKVEWLGRLRNNEGNDNSCSTGSSREKARRWSGEEGDSWEEEGDRGGEVLRVRNHAQR